MGMKKWWKAAAFLTVCMMLLSGCASGDKASGASQGKESQEQSSVSESAASSKAPSAPSKAPESSQATESSDSQTSTQPVGADFFNDAVFVGDSVSLRLTYYCQSHKGVLGTSQFLTSGSLGSGNALEKISEDSVHPVYQGEKMLIEDGVKASGAKKVFIMLGMNDIGLYGVEDSVKNMETLVERILEKSPDVEIYIQSMTPMLKETQLKQLNNPNLDKYNQQLKALCEEKGYHFADVASVMKDEEGNLIPEYCSDPEGMGIHFTDAGAQAWIDYLIQNADSF